MEAFLGEWKLQGSEGFDSVMQCLGVNAFTRKAANMVKPRCIITTRGDGYRMESVSEFKTTGFDFRLGEPFMEKTPDGRRVKSTITLAENVLNQVQAGEKTTHIDRIINGDTLETTVKVEDLTSRRTYQRA